MGLPRCKVSLGKRFRNPLDVTSYKPIRLTSAVPASNPVTSMVSLLPAIKPNLSQSDRIQIIAADLTDLYGRPLDGNDDGVPGGNYVAIVTKNGATPAAVAAPANMMARAVDAVLQKNGLLAPCPPPAPGTWPVSGLGELNVGATCGATPAMRAETQ